MIYIDVLKKYAVFSGRAGRKEYWWFALINAVFYYILLTLMKKAIGNALLGGLMILPSLYFLAIILPGLAVSVRRLHDSNHSGWWVLINFVPFVGQIIFFILALLPSDAGDNRFGPKSS